MTPDPRLALAETISRIHGERMGFDGDGLDRFVACDRHFWRDDRVMDALLDAARPIIEPQVRAMIEAEMHRQLVCVDSFSVAADGSTEYRRRLPSGEWEVTRTPPTRVSPFKYDAEGVPFGPERREGAA